MKHYRIFVVILWIGFLTACSSMTPPAKTPETPPRGQYHLERERARAMESEKKYKTALSIYKKLLRDYPDKTYNRNDIQRMKALIKPSEDAYMRGMRFYRDRNLRRAKTAFEQALDYCADNLMAKMRLDEIRKRDEEPPPHKVTYTYIVRSGDTLSEIAMGIYGTYKTLVEWDEKTKNYRKGESPKASENVAEMIARTNDIDPAKLYAGQKIHLPKIDGLPFKPGELPPSGEDPGGAGHEPAPKPWDPDAPPGIILPDTDAARIEKEYQKAVDEFKREHWNEALRLFKKLNAESPDYKDVAAHIDRINEILDKKKKDDYIQKGVEMLKNGEFEKAIEFFLLAEVLSPEDPKIFELLAKSYFDKGVKLFNKKEYTEAEIAFARALIYNPDDAACLEYFEGCKKAIEKAKREKLEALYQKGCDDKEKRNWCDALTSFGRIMEIDPTYRETRQLWEESKDCCDVVNK